jgi:hypothetical protein
MNDHPSPEHSIYSALSEGSRGNLFFVAPGKHWREELAETLASCASGQAVVVVEGQLRPLVIALVRERRLPRTASPMARAVRRHLTSLDWNVATTYRVWPSTAQPRVAIPIAPHTVTTWMQRNGLIGGGTRGWIRLSLRHRLALPLLTALAGGTAMQVLA